MIGMEGDTSPIPFHWKASDISAITSVATNINAITNEATNINADDHGDRIELIGDSDNDADEDEDDPADEHVGDTESDDKENDAHDVRHRERQRRRVRRGRRPLRGPLVEGVQLNRNYRERAQIFWALWFWQHFPEQFVWSPRVL